VKARRWPFDGDSPVVRARKMALAYRALAEEQQSRLDAALDLLSRVDERVLRLNPDTGVAAGITKLLSREAINEPVPAMDARFYEWGEEWHAELSRHYDSDEWITGEDAGHILTVAPQTVSRMRTRGRLVGKLVKVPGQQGGGRWYYLAADIYALSAEKRARSSPEVDATDSLQASGSSDGE
jgi:hypothetical protein